MNAARTGSRGLACSAEFMRRVERLARDAGWKPGTQHGKTKPVVDALSHHLCLDRSQIYRALQAVELLHHPKIRTSTNSGEVPHPTILWAAAGAKDKAPEVVRRAMDEGWTKAQVRAEVRRLKAARAPAAPVPGTVRRQDALAFLRSLAPASADLLLTDPPYMTDVEDVAAFARAWAPLALTRVKPTVERAVPDDDQALAYVIRANLARRQLSGDQLAELRERQRALARALRAGGKTQAATAAILGVAQKTVDLWESPPPSASDSSPTNASAPADPPDLRVKLKPEHYEAIAARAKEQARWVGDAESARGCRAA